MLKNGACSKVSGGRAGGRAAVLRCALCARTCVLKDGPRTCVHRWAQRQGLGILRRLQRAAGCAGVKARSTHAVAACVVTTARACPPTPAPSACHPQCAVAGCAICPTNNQAICTACAPGFVANRNKKVGVCVTTLLQQRQRRPGLVAAGGRGGSGCLWQRQWQRRGGGGGGLLLRWRLAKHAAGRKWAQQRCWCGTAGLEVWPSLLPLPLPLPTTGSASAAPRAAGLARWPHAKTSARPARPATRWQKTSFATR